MIYFTIYKITNLVNGRYYIGKHLTRNLEDKYFGSGKVLLEALAKYGKESFLREIIFLAKDKKSMDWAERELVVPMHIDPQSYNIKFGGEGGAAHGAMNSFYGRTHSQETKERIRTKNFGIRRSPKTEFKSGQNVRLGAKLSFDQKQKISEATKQAWKDGKLVPRAKGLIWINNGTTCRMIPSHQIVPEGFIRGRLTNRRS